MHISAKAIDISAKAMDISDKVMYINYLTEDLPAEMTLDKVSDDRASHNFLRDNKIYDQDAHSSDKPTHLTNL
jgi:hypothetical protein